MVTFANEKSIETIAVIGGTTQFQNAQRATIEIRAARDETNFEELRAIYTDSKALSEIEVNDGNGGQSLQLDFTLPMELSLKDIDGEQLWCMKLAQRSALEIAQEKQAASINDTQLALIEDVPAKWRKETETLLNDK